MIYFYYPVNTHKPGGVQNLILNIARGLYSKGINCGILTFLNGYIHKQVIEEKLDCTFIDADKPNLEGIKPDDVFVIFGALEPALKDLKGVNARILYWSVFPDTLIQTFKIRIPARSEVYSNANPLSKYYTRRLAHTLANGHSGFFMDESHLKVLENYGVKGVFNHQNLLPIPVKVGARPTLKNLPPKGETLRLAYIGRAEDWKMFPFVSLVRDLENVHSNFSICIDIISEEPGQYLSFLEKHFHLPENIRFELHDDLAGESLTTFLLTHTHLLFAMGTSLLEGCKAGVPAIITDPAYKVVPNSKYRFVADEKGFCLGIPSWVFANQQGKRLQQVFDSHFCDNTSYQSLCNHSYLYVADYHNLDSWIDGFVGHIVETSIHIQDLKFVRLFFVVRRFLYEIAAKMLFASNES
jgi:hypothetical protein